MKLLNMVIKCINRVENFLMVWLTMGFGVLIMYEIIMRALGLTNIPWLEEFSRYMLVYTTLLGSSMAIKDNGHMAMDTLMITLSKPIVKVLHVLINIICTATWIVVAYFSLEWTLRLKLIGTTAGSVSLAMWIIWVPVVVFCASSAIRYAIQICKSIAALRVREAEGGEVA